MIDYHKIADSCSFYEALGYQRIESPWLVTKPVMDITSPNSGNPEPYALARDNKVLVASGEQSFLYLYLKGFIPKGKFQTVTPCFRHETFDPLHSKYFLKNELIITDFAANSDKEQLEQIINDAKKFYQRYFSKDIEVVQTGSTQFDITYQGDELGSYGIRRCDFLTWVYGTGCAEPRLSAIIKKHGYQ